MDKIEKRWLSLVDKYINSSPKERAEILTLLTANALENVLLETEGEEWMKESGNEPVLIEIRIPPVVREFISEYCKTFGSPEASFESAIFTDLILKGISEIASQRLEKQISGSNPKLD